MKIMYVFSCLLIAALVFVAPCAQGQSYTDLYGNYNYRGNLKVGDTTFLKRLVTGDCRLDSSALAQFNSTCKGILVPRLTTGQMDSIANPANGLLVYDITAGCFFYYNDSAWMGMGACSGTGTSSGKYWNLTGDSGTSSALNYIGTSDSNGLVFKTNGITFGSVDAQQHFNFSTVMDSAIYGFQTTNNILGTGASGIFAANETVNFGFYEVDGAVLGLGGPMALVGAPSGSHISVTDSAINMHSHGTVVINGNQSLELDGNSNSLIVNGQQIAENAPLITAFNPTILPDNIADSSAVYSNIVLDGATYGNNTLSGGAMLSENLLFDAGSTCVGNTLVGDGGIFGWVAGIASNQLHVASHLDSNYLEGAAQMQDLGKHSHASNFSHNYLKSLSLPVQIYGISGESVENVVWDSLTDGNGIYNLTLMNFDSVAYNVLSGANINNLIMQNSDLNYCHFLSADKGFSFSQLFNSRIVNDTVSVVNCFFHNVTKDFGSETQDWFDVMLLNDYVGIGITTKPVASLQVGDSANHQTFKYVDGNEGTGKVLTSDADGNATWQVPGLLTDTTAYFTPGSADTIVVAPYNYNIIDSTGVLSSLFISLPLSPVEGEWIEVKLAQSGVAVQYLNGAVANSVPTYIPPQNLYIKLVFRAARNTWY